MKQGTSTANFNILVIEDQTRHQKIFRDTFLSELNAEARFANSGEEGLASIAGDEKPDLVILDLDLPKMSGREVLQRIKSDIATRLIPVIILTGSSSQIVEMDLLENGAEDYLEKGSHPEILLSRIKAQIRHKRAIDRLQQLTIDRDIFAAGVLAHISTTHKSLNEESDKIKSMLASDPVGNTPEILKLMDQMCEQASRLGQFSNDVIQSVRDSHRSANPQEISLDDFMRIATSISAKSRTPGANSTISFEMKSDEKLGIVCVDRDYFRIVMLNILQNIAERAKTSSEKIPLSMQTEPAKLPGFDRAVKLVIRDFGVSIPQKNLASLFEPRITSSDDATPTFDISLAVVSNAVRKLNGLIWAENPDDKKGGSEFHLILPRDMY